MEPSLSSSPTKFRAVKLPKSEWFACSKHHVKATFDQLLEYVSFGIPKSFEGSLPHRSGKSHFAGQIVASLTFFPRRKPILLYDRIISTGDPCAYLYLYAVPRDNYSVSARQVFVEETLARMRVWLDAEFDKPETQSIGRRQLVVEWRDGDHILHSLRQ